MRRVVLVLTVAAVAAGIWLSAARSQDQVEEPSTKEVFPRTVEFEYNGTDYELQVTGVAVRKKFFVKVYAIAHYMDMEVADFKDILKALDTVLSDSYAKQITLDFVRDVGVDDIQKAYRSGFEKNATDEEKEVIAPFVEQFLGYFTKDVEKGDQYILRWIPDGIVLATVNGETYGPIANVTFAKALWRIWLGDKSPVDRKKLVEMAVED
ncbi:MAG: chalcone isomerase family protein [bacterium]